MVFLLEDSPISTEELWSCTIWLLVTSLTKAFVPLIAQFGQTASSMKSPGGSKLLPFKNDGLCCSEFFLTFPQICASIKSLYWDVDGQFLRLHGLVFPLICTVNGGTLYRRGVCVCLPKSCPIN